MVERVLAPSRCLGLLTSSIPFAPGGTGDAGGASVPVCETTVVGAATFFEGLGSCEAARAAPASASASEFANSPTSMHVMGLAPAVVLLACLS